MSYFFQLKCVDTALQFFDTSNNVIYINPWDYLTFA